MSAFQIKFSNLISLVLAALLIPLSVITYGIDFISFSERNDVARENVTGIGAYFRSQGITSDGENLFFSSKTTLIKTKSDARTLINADYSAIPEELSSEYGIKHIGGISFYNGKIYAGMEDSKVWKYPIIGVFDADTLALENYYVMDSSQITRGMPWVAVNPETGILYCMNHSKKPDLILAYDTGNNMSKISEVKLSETVNSIQGAEFSGGYLYAATNDGTQAIYKINPVTGEVSRFIDRNLTKGSEGEGMTFIERDGKKILVAMDMGPIFVNAFVREYDFSDDLTY